MCFAKLEQRKEKGHRFANEMDSIANPIRRRGSGGSIKTKPNPPGRTSINHHFMGCFVSASVLRSTPGPINAGPLFCFLYAVSCAGRVPPGSGTGQLPLRESVLKLVTFRLFRCKLKINLRPPSHQWERVVWEGILLSCRG